MHEVSLINNVIRSLETEFTQEELAKLVKIDMQIGVFANVEPILMQNAFEAVKQSSQKFKNVVLDIESIPIRIFCDNCKIESIITDYNFRCSKCLTPNNNLISGTELVIKTVHFDN